MSRIYDPYINPLQFVELNKVELPQYVTRFMDDFWLEERLTQWQQLPHGRYVQPWLPQDVISLQFQNNSGPLVATIINCAQTIQQPFPMQQLQQNKYDPAYFIYESHAALNVLPDDVYFKTIDVGNTGLILISEPFFIASTQPDTLLFQYKNRSFYGNVIFETGIEMSLRLPGIMKLAAPPSKDTLYEDQVLDMVMVQSKPYRVWNLTLGVKGGIPDWMVDKLNWILGCSDLRINGRYFTKNDGAKLAEQNRLGDTLAEYTIEMRESINRNSKIYDTTLDPNERLTLVLNSTSKGFADTSSNGSSSVVQFIDIE